MRLTGWYSRAALTADADVIINLTGKLTQSEDEGLVTLWYYDESDRITHRTVNGEPAEQWQYDGHGWLTTVAISVKATVSLPTTATTIRAA